MSTPEPDPRFDRLRRLVGPAAARRLAAAHVMLVGLGGVGSWAAESLARSGIGTLTLVDPDTVCPTNFNRQLPALQDTVGRPKAEVLAARLRAVNPAADIRPVVRAYSAATSAELLAARPDYVVDAIDSVAAKAHLLAACRALGLPAVTSTGSGGRLDPARIEVADLADTDVDPLAKMIRKLLRRDHGFPKEGQGPFGIPAVFSREQPRLPAGDAADDLAGRPHARKKIILGTVAHITGAFGLRCAAVVVSALLGPPDTDA